MRAPWGFFWQCPCEYETEARTIELLQERVLAHRQWHHKQNLWIATGQRD